MDRGGCPQCIGEVAGPFLSLASEQSPSCSELPQRHSSRLATKSHSLTAVRPAVCCTEGERREASETRYGFSEVKENWTGDESTPPGCGEDQSRVLRKCGSSAALQLLETYKEKRDLHNQELLENSAVPGARPTTVHTLQEPSLHLDDDGKDGAVCVREGFLGQGIFQDTASESRPIQRLEPERLTREPWSSVHEEVALVSSVSGSRRNSAHAVASTSSQNDGESQDLHEMLVGQRSGGPLPEASRLGLQTQSSFSAPGGGMQPVNCPPASSRQRCFRCSASPETDKDTRQCCAGSRCGCLAGPRGTCGGLGHRSETEPTPHDTLSLAVEERRNGGACRQVWNRLGAGCLCCPCFFAAAASGMCAVSSVSAFLMEEIMGATSSRGDTMEQPRCSNSRLCQGGVRECGETVTLNARTSDTSDYADADQGAASGAEHEVFPRSGPTLAVGENQGATGEVGGKTVDVFTERRARDPLSGIPADRHVLALLRQLACKQRLKEAAAGGTGPLWWGTLDSRLRELILRLLVLETAHSASPVSIGSRVFGDAFQSRVAAVGCQPPGNWRGEVTRGPLDQECAAVGASHSVAPSRRLQEDASVSPGGSAHTGEDCGEFSSVSCLDQPTVCRWCDSCGVDNTGTHRSFPERCKQVGPFCDIYLMAATEVACSTLDGVCGFDVDGRKSCGNPADAQCSLRVSEASSPVLQSPPLGVSREGLNQMSSGGLSAGRDRDTTERRERSDQVEDFSTQKEEPEREKKDAHDDADGEMTCD